jgi:GT2 family glycosyltransferase
MKKITIIITRYNESNILVNSCLNAISKQEGIKIITYFLDQKNDEKIKSLCKELSNNKVKIIYKNIPVKSLSYARNIGINLSKTKIVLFTDADAIPNKEWAYELFKIFIKDDKIAIVGGMAIPKWAIKPKWYHKSNTLMDKYSIFDLGRNIKETEEIVGVNFGLNKNLLTKETFFDENLGRRPGSLLGGEESDLCKRAKKIGFKVFYNGKAIVQHQIQEDRMNLLWVIKRFYYAGYGKAIVGGMPKTYSSKRNIYDRLILIIIFLPYLIGFLRGKLSKLNKK